MIGVLLAFQIAGLGQPSLHVGDLDPLVDPLRPVTEIGRTSVTIAYTTASPTETRVQVREGQTLAIAWRRPENRKDPWKEGEVREFRGPEGKRLRHTITLTGLRPGRRYFYRVYDPDAVPTRQESEWGASPPWRREYAVSTLAPAGRKTIIRLPVKVLVMTNVVNVPTAHDENGAIAPPPERFTDEQLRKVKEEFAKASLFFWVNSGMRLWVDWHFFVDDRWQRWGQEPARVDPFYRGWPVCRSYTGEDYRGPGGGGFTILDTRDPLRTNDEPVEEELPYAGQIELAMLRFWNKERRRWEFRNSGGGTLGIDSFPSGIPSRCQYLGGGDIAWLTAHEFHHTLESLSAFFLAHREDERIVFNHYEPRRRVAKPDGGFQEMTWTTSGRHGEHWDGMRYWDRTLSDAQWLRFAFGETITVADRDGDGFPDDDPRLPLDEKRFGSFGNRMHTDGRLTDLQKAMLSGWVPNPLQSTWVKPEPEYFPFEPRNPDSDRDGLTDDVDPLPLVAAEPIIVPRSVEVDGVASEWEGVPVAGRIAHAGPSGPVRELVFQQAHDHTAWYGLFRARGDWARIEAVFDGEGLGVFSSQGVQGVIFVRNDDKIEARPHFGAAPGLRWEARRDGDTWIVEFSWPNRGEGLWFWDRGGREIGSQINLYTPAGAGYAMWAPYFVFYARMLEPHGRPPLPRIRPETIEASPDAIEVRPGDPRVRVEEGWRVEDGRWAYDGHDERALLIEGLDAGEFDLWVEINARQDGILGAFLPATPRATAGADYVAFVGGYANRITRLRLFGAETGDSGVMMDPAVSRTLQLSRRMGGVWLFVDGRLEIYAPDPNPAARVDRLAVIGGYGGAQRVARIRYRVEPAVQRKD